MFMIHVLFFNTWRQRQNGKQHFQKHFIEWNIWISIEISLKFVPKSLIDNKLSLDGIKAWC